MSFLKIKNPSEREQVVKEFLEIKKNIRANELAEKTGKIELREDLSELFKPITETQKAAAKEITEGLRPIKEGIEQLPQELPKREKPFLLPFIKKETPFSPPPEYMSPMPSTSKEQISEPQPGTENTNFGFYEKGGTFYIGDQEVEEIKDEYGNNELVVGTLDKQSYPLTPGLIKLLSTKKYDKKNPIYTDKDIQRYRDILIKTNTMYVDNEEKSGELKPKPEGMSKDHWALISSSWKIQDVQKALKKGKKGKTGKGLKKVVIPGDPNALLEKLDLLIASKAAGNTGLRNELVSVCDELKRQGIFGNETYKRITSLL